MGGGGILAEDLDTEGSTIIVGNIIRSNHCDGGTPGIMCSKSLVLNNTISSNTLSGWGTSTAGIRATSSVIVGNTIADHAGYAIAAGGDSSIVSDCTIVHNVTGLSIGGKQSIALRNLIAYNSWGVVPYDGSLISGSLIAGNGDLWEEYTAIWIRNSARIENCTIVGSWSYCGHSCAIYVMEGFFPTVRTVISNCIIGNNRVRISIKLFPFAGDSLSLCLHNNILGGRDSVLADPYCGFWGPGNIDADPLFVDPGHWDDGGTPTQLFDDTFTLGDYHLLPGSPCIDAGTNDVDNPDTPEIEALPDTDIAGLPRIIDGNLDGTATVDIGAYEYLPGDVNYDGRVNVLDLILVRNSLGRDPASSIEARKADVNADGSVNVQDLLVVRGGLGR